MLVGSEIGYFTYLDNRMVIAATICNIFAFCQVCECNKFENKWKIRAKAVIFGFLFGMMAGKYMTFVLWYFNPKTNGNINDDQYEIVELYNTSLANRIFILSIIPMSSLTICFKYMRNRVLIYGITLIATVILVAIPFMILFSVGINDSLQIGYVIFISVCVNLAPICHSQRVLSPLAKYTDRQEIMLLDYVSDARYFLKTLFVGLIGY